MVTHSELSSGYQSAQTAHAVADFARHHPEEFSRWHSESNYIVILEAADEDSLHRLTEKAHNAALRTTQVREPDIGDALTAVTFHPDPANRKFLANLPCVGKGDKRQERINLIKSQVVQT